MSPAALEQTKVWGEKDWFRQHFVAESANNASSYFSHDRNGYQIFRHRRLLNCIRSELGSVPLTSMLDVGCGTGTLTDLIARECKFPRAVGVDFVAEVIEHARVLYPQREFHVGALPAIALPSDSFELAVASEVIYYLGDSERQQAVREVARVLKPEGYFLFTSRIGSRYFSPQTACALLEPHFRIVRKWYLHNKLYHGLMKPAHALSVASRYVTDQAEPQGPRSRRMTQKYGWLLRTTPVRQAICVGAGIGEMFARSSALPTVCHRVAQTCLPRYSRSNIVILAQVR